MALAFGIADDLLVAIVPSIVYWMYSGMYALLGDMDDYRLHPKEDVDSKNIVSKREVVKGVLIQQALQIGVSIAMFLVQDLAATRVFINTVPIKYL